MTCAIVSRAVRRPWLAPRALPGCGDYVVSMILRPFIARVFWALSPYGLRSEAPPTTSAVMIGAPHTSNWDLPLMLALAWRHGFAPKWLGKSQLFRSPFGRLMRALGGIPVDRENPAGLVDEIVRRMEGNDRFFLVVTPEGTRKRREYWKSGFYRIARGTGLPLVLGYVDSASRTTGLGPTIRLTGDVSADMDRIRAFYADKRGIRPDGFTPPRLREEDSPGGRAPRAA